MVVVLLIFLLKNLGARRGVKIACTPASSLDSASPLHLTCLWGLWDRYGTHRDFGISATYGQTEGQLL